MKRQIKRLAVRAIAPALKVAARSYIAGPHLEDALRVARDIKDHGHHITIGLWDGPDDTAQSIAEGYLNGLRRLAETDKHAYLSIKLPALDYSTELLDRTLEGSAQSGTRVHFDSLAPDTANKSWSVLEDRVRSHTNIGCTLPSRWRRSVHDADKAIALGWFVRVVKGQWADPVSPEVNPRQGYIAVIERLAGRARHVSVATHDVSLATQAIEILQRAGTPCDLELLFGLPKGPSLKALSGRSIDVRFYVPYGTSYGMHRTRPPFRTKNDRHQIHEIHQKRKRHRSLFRGFRGFRGNSFSKVCDSVYPRIPWRCFFRLAQINSY